MTVHLKILGMLEKPSGKADLDVDLPPGSAVADLLRSLGYSERHAAHILSHRRGRLLSSDAELSDGDRVELSILLGGG